MQLCYGGRIRGADMEVIIYLPRQHTTSLQLLGVSAHAGRGPARMNVVAGQLHISPSSRPREHSVACYWTGLSGRSLAQTAVIESSAHTGEPCLRLLCVVSSTMRRMRIV